MKKKQNNPKLWIELPWLENLVNTYAWYTEKLVICFDLIKSHQQCIPWSPPLEMEPVTMDCRVETLQVSQLLISHISDAKLTIMVIAHPTNLNESCKLHPYSLQRIWSPPGPRLLKRIRNMHPRNYYDLKSKDVDVDFLF